MGDRSQARKAIGWLLDRAAEGLWQALVLALVGGTSVSAIFKGVTSNWLLTIGAGGITFVMLIYLARIVGIIGKRRRLIASFDQITNGTFNANQIPFVSLIVSIRNLGAPTIVERYSFVLEFPNGVKREGLLETIPEAFSLTFADGTVERMSHGEALDLRTMSQPIPTGGMVRGRLMFSFQELDISVLKSPGFEFKLSFVDAWGKVHSSSAKLSGTHSRGAKDKLLNFPGIQPLLVPTAAPGTELDQARSHGPQGGQAAERSDQGQAPKDSPTKDNPS